MTATRTLAAIRFGYGLPLPDGAPDTAQAMLAALAGPDLAAQRWPIDGLAVIQPKLAELRGMKGAGKTDPALKPRHDQLTVEVVAAVEQSERMTFVRALSAADGLRERLVAFWADHFTVVSKSMSDGMMPFALTEDVIRPRLTGRFSDMLTEATLHPAMLIYLDQVQSTGPNSFMGLRKEQGLNENLARELIELHAMGAGAGYAQADVRALAELLTGVTYDPRRGMWFEPRRAEPGAETVLGQTYDGEGLEPIRRALGNIARRPETAAHIARKLAVHFVSDTPDPDLVAALEATFLASEGDLMAVYTALLLHPAAWQEAAEKIRQPFDFMIAALRAMDLTAERFLALKRGQFRQQVLRGMTGMGQAWRRPPGPDGWAEAADAWISPQLLAARITWAMQAPQRLIRPMPDPVAFARTCLGDRASERLLWAVARAENRTEGVGLVLASAEFNRR